MRGGDLPPDSFDGGTVKHSITVATNRDGALAAATAVPGQDVIVLQIAGGPELRLHPETARDLMNAQNREAAGRGAPGAVVAAGEVAVPMQLAWPGLDQGTATRGIGGVLLSIFKVVTGIGQDTVADFAVSKVVQNADGQVDEGVYALSPSAMTALKGTPKLATIPAATAGAPTLVLIHGTFSSTEGTFNKLWSQQPAVVAKLFGTYAGRVYALDHRTLGVSPIANALTLAQAAPAGAQLHLLTHSRGGLVAETLARACATPDDVATQFQNALADARESWGSDADSRQKAFDVQLADLQQLAAVVKAKGLKVTRMVRVACPVRGTTLASRRLDAYISVLKWALELAHIPVAPELVGLLGAVAQKKADPAELPGLEAQMPDSVLVQWLHAVDQPLPGDLRVVAGDMQGDSVITWVKTLLSDAFYWSDNDLVVQTRSMYGGAPRANSAVFVLDQGGAVSHFSYFANDKTAQAVLAGLTIDAPAGFTTIGPLSWAGESSDGVRGAAAITASDTSQRDKPLVFILPGIVGSNLKVGAERIWLGWHVVNGFSRLAYRLGEPDAVLPDGPVGSTYDPLSDFLAETHAVVEFGFDWRKPIEEEAARLAVEVSAALAVREANGLPVRIIAHSMGGVLARAMQIVDGSVWSQMMARKGARVLMLGVPNAGSFAPMQVLSGDDRFGNLLAMVGAPFRSNKARQVIADFPGLLQLQAGLSGTMPELGNAKAWQDIAERDLAWLAEHSLWHCLPVQISDNAWGLPSQDVLDRAVKLRKDLDAQLTVTPSLFANVAVVVGHADVTPDGYSCGPDDPGLVYLDLRDDGDGRVTRERAMLPGVPAWKVDADHGSLPRVRSAFEGYLELLNTGTTTLLPSASAAPVVHERSRPSRAQMSAPPAEQPTDVLHADGRSGDATANPVDAALKVSVIHGDLSFVGEPLLLGHYRAMRLTGTERVMDTMIGGTMQQSLLLGRYPTEPRTNQVFDNARPHLFGGIPRPQSVIVVGLGDEGSLRPEELVSTVTQGVLAWAQRVAESRNQVPAQFEIAATLIGSGGISISAGDAAHCIAQGVCDANALLGRQEPANRWPRVGKLSLIELYLDRATEAWGALRAMAATTPALLDVTEYIENGTGGMRLPPSSGYRGADYDFISVQTDTSGSGGMVYSLDTRRARTDVRAKSLQLKLVRLMVQKTSGATNRAAELGQTLFRLLIPAEIKPFFGDTSALVLQLDGGTAGIPWELLDTGTSGGNGLPWGIRAKLLRKLRVESPPPIPQDATADAHVLVVGEPATPPGYPRLFGAREEAMAVATLLSKEIDRDGQSRVRSVIRGAGSSDPGPDASAVIGALLERDWRIIHVAGHGEPPLNGQLKDSRGVVLSDGIYLGPCEIADMPVVPELVFVNCCHLAARSADETLAYDRSAFAAGVAEALITVGVRCVIAAGWAVDDDAAKTFATTFYGSLMNRKRFLDAVSDARIAAYKCGGNTWAAYQCYGDPDWVFRTSTPDAQRPPESHDEALANIASPTALKLTLEMIAIQASNSNEYDTFAEKLVVLEGRYGARWGKLGEIAEGFAVAWNELGNRATALKYYKTAVEAEDGSASIKASEQLCNVRARLAWDVVFDAVQKGATATDLSAVIQKGVADVGLSLALLAKISDYRSTSERESLLASAHKRLAMIQRVAGDSVAEEQAMNDARTFYERAWTRGLADKSANVFYPGLNGLALCLALDCALEPALVTAIDESLKAKAGSDPDFWSVSGASELALYKAVENGTLADACTPLMAAYAQLHGRVPSPRKWHSIYDTAYFVLDRYRNGPATAAERAAASALLTTIASFTK